jgi:hypothetical protein
METMKEAFAKAGLPARTGPERRCRKAIDRLPCVVQKKSEQIAFFSLDKRIGDVLRLSPRMEKAREGGPRCAFFVLHFACRAELPSGARRRRHRRDGLRSRLCPLGCLPSTICR